MSRDQVTDTDCIVGALEELCAAVDRHREAVERETLAANERNAQLITALERIAFR